MYNSPDSFFRRLFCPCEAKLKINTMRGVVTRNGECSSSCKRCLVGIFLNAMKISIPCFSPLKEAVVFFFTDKVDIETIRELVKKAGVLESDVDKNEWDTTRDIFNADLDYGHKIHLKLCIQRIVEVSDRTEDAADQLEITIIKGGI